MRVLGFTEPGRQVQETRRFCRPQTQAAALLAVTVQLSCPTRRRRSFPEETELRGTCRCLRRLNSAVCATLPATAAHELPIWGIVLQILHRCQTLGLCVGARRLARARTTTMIEKYSPLVACTRIDRKLLCGYLRNCSSERMFQQSGLPSQRGGRGSPPSRC